VLERYYRELLNFCARTVKDRDTAAEVVQESYARVLAIQRSRVSITEPRALLYQTARHVMVDQHRRGLLRSHDDLGAFAEADHPAMPVHLEPDALLASSQAIHAYVATIEALPPRCREAFILHVFDGLSHMQIAERIGASMSMIEKHIARGRLECRACQRTLQGLSAKTGAPKEK
jgi:RNA polymerase sigma factor (sigma-70 family)